MVLEDIEETFTELLPSPDFVIQQLYAGGEDGLFATAGVAGVALAELLVGIGA